METIMEESQEQDTTGLQKKKIKKQSLTRGISEDKKKKLESDMYLKDINKKLDAQKSKQFKNQVQSGIESAIELS